MAEQRAEGTIRCRGTAAANCKRGEFAVAKPRKNGLQISLLWFRERERGRGLEAMVGQHGGASPRKSGLLVSLE
jgi:hypothetical protein